MREIFPSSYEEKFIGGWISAEKRKNISSKKDITFLKKLLVEIDSDLLRKIIPREIPFDGKLFRIKWPKSRPVNADQKIHPHSRIELSSPWIDFKLVRKLEERTIPQKHSVHIIDGDVLKITNKDTGYDLSLRFGFNQVRTHMLSGKRGKERLVAADITYLLIFYREKENQSIREIPYMIYIQALETGNSYHISKNRENLFLGKKGLFIFNADPSKLIHRLYIPDNIREGGLADIKEMLDRQMFYRKDDKFFPIDRNFLLDVRSQVPSGIKAFNRYFKEKNISWRQFEDQNEIQTYLGIAEKTLEKMKKKGSWPRFNREIRKLNDNYLLKGLGINTPKRTKYTVFYKTADLSWIRARPWFYDTPIVDGISEYHWGNLIKKSDRVQFRIDFLENPGTIDLISIADYKYSFDNKQYQKHHFFDGVQQISFPSFSKQLFISVSNINRFNSFLSTSSLQLSINDGSSKLLITDETWSASIDLINWNPVLVKPLYQAFRPEAREVIPVWYYEKWKPFFRGIKNRYFRKVFRLKAVPRNLLLNVFTSGHYLVWINNQIVYSNSNIDKFLKPGRNTIMVQVSKRGYLKKLQQSELFRIRDNKIFLKQQLIRRTSFVRGKAKKRPTILDRNKNIIAYSSEINGESKRFFSSMAKTELQSIVGGGRESIWGLEQVFWQLSREEKLSEIVLTINQDWQKIALKSIYNLLEKNKKREASSPKYIQLRERLKSTESRLRRLRNELFTNRDNIGIIMEDIIRQQAEIDELKNEINKIKNPFYEASVILMNPQGQILVAASYPYNEKTMKELNSSIPRPYRAYEIPSLNRAWKWNYNPGSTAKILDSIAFLHSEKLRTAGSDTRQFPLLHKLLDHGQGYGIVPRTDIKGSRMLNGKFIGFHLQNFRGHNIPPGYCSLDEALIHSYNTYFAFLGLHVNKMLVEDSRYFEKPVFFVSRANIPITKSYREYPVLKFAEQFLMNKKINLLHNLRNSEINTRLSRRPYDAFFSAASVFPVNAYSANDVAYYSIGQSDFQLTALQNAIVASSILNEGVFYYPSIVMALKLKDKQTNKQKTIQPDPKDDKIAVFRSEIASQIKEAMKNVVNRGTAGGVFPLEFKKDRTFYAKTGTAETKLYRDNSLFVGFCTFRDGTGAVFSVIVPRSGTGAAFAGRLTSMIIQEIVKFENQRGKNL
jgi:cell division protein FtsI/penicillin-binding protein 2